MHCQDSYCMLVKIPVTCCLVACCSGPHLSQCQLRLNNEGVQCNWVASSSSVQRLQHHHESLHYNGARSIVCCSAEHWFGACRSAIGELELYSSMALKVMCVQVKFWLGIGKDKKEVLQYRMKRVPGQGPLLSKVVRWGFHSAPADFTALSTEGLVCTDLSNGQENCKVTSLLVLMPQLLELPVSSP